MAERLHSPATEPGSGLSTAALQVALEEAPVGLCVLDPAGLIVDANPLFGRMVGTPANDLIGLSHAQVTHPDDLNEFRRLLEHVRRGDLDRFMLDQRFLRRDGSHFWAAVTLSAVRYGRGRVAHTVTMIQDITRSRATHGALRRDEARLAEVARIQERIAEAALDLDTALALILEGVQRLTGAEATMLSEVSGQEIVWVAGTGQAAEHVGFRLGLSGNLSGECVVTGRSVLCDDTLSDPRSDPAMYDLTGYRSLIYVPLTHQGRPVGVVGAYAGTPAFFAADDLTTVQLMAGLMGSVMAHAREYGDHKAAQARLSTILEAGPVALFAFDREGVITVMEGRALAGLGLGLGERPTYSVSELFRTPRRLGAGIRAALAGEEFATSFPLPRTGRHFEARFTPMRDAEGRPAGGTGVIMDVSDRLEAAQARQESEAKSRFLATVSHELRTPLNSVIGFSQLMATDREAAALSVRQRRYLANIETSGRQLLAVINDLLDIGRIQAGQLDLRPEDVELQGLLRDATGGFAEQAADRGLSVELAMGPPVWVRADRRRLGQVLVNLLSNALKFTPGGGLIRVEAVPDPDMPMVVVSDSGIGIPSAELDRVFDEFTQVESGMTRNQEGSGLGLALCRRLVELMDGNIGVASEVGQGSVFTIALPRARAVPSVSPSRDRPSGETAHSHDRSARTG